MMSPFCIAQVLIFHNFACIMPLEMERQILTIMNHVDGVNDTPFHDPDNPIVITEYTFTSKRMGNVSLTATLMHDTCLDNEWDGTQYVTFNGEKYFISATPSSSKSSDDARYRHDLTFMAERDIKLNNIYFYDAVSEESTGDDKYKSNSTKVVFFGDIHEFVARLNESLAYSNVGYTAVVDDGITSEAKLMSFEDQFFFNVLQEIFNVYELPFYFVGTVIHIGFTANAITHPFKYGFDNELISIKKNNANYRIVTRCTGTGSSDNIPYYYPNKSPKGSVSAKAGENNTGITQSDIEIFNYEIFSQKLKPEDILSFGAASYTVSYVDKDTIYDDPFKPGGSIEMRPGQYSFSTRYIGAKLNVSRPGIIFFSFDWSIVQAEYPETIGCECTVSIDSENGEILSPYETLNDGTLRSSNAKKGEYIQILLKKTGNIEFDIAVIGHKDNTFLRVFTISFTPQLTADNVWLLNNESYVILEDVGLRLTATPEVGDTITQLDEGYITPSDKLLPPIYRESGGAERFYNAVNDTYTNPDTGGKYVFENEFVANAPKEHIVEFEDIKPTIKGAENASGQRMDQILDIAFDTDDNDDVDEEGNYVHPHFFVKLAKFNGEWGFNLFDQAIEDEEMTLAMTSGDCGACEFTIKVGEETQKNIVQVDSAGNLKRDEDGNVITSGEPQDRQNDTRNYEVWLALEKEESTYGQIMPNALQNIRPKTGDSFVLLNIKMPDEYVYRAEAELKEAIIKYMAENNAEKFNFSIDFSRIYLAQNKDIASQLNENARIQLEYNGRLAEFYISQYTYKCVDGEALPEVMVELTDTVTVTKTTLQNSIDAVRQDIQNGIGSIDFLKQGLRYFLRKDVDYESRGTPRFLGGAEFGRFTSGILGSGAAVRIDSNNASHMEVDYLSVRRRADFTTISVQELKQIGGQLIISPAAMVCSRVEETETAYRCYFDSGKESGKLSIVNQFAVNDQARMQVFNQWGGRYFWRLVTAVGDDWIDLSKTDCEEGSDIPQEGDNIVQLGNRNDTARQSAQVFSCFGENAPSFIMYNGINSYDLTGKNITGIVYNPETGEPQMYSYGSFFFGDRDIDAEDANYITYQQKAGDTKKKLFISADIKLGSGSSGLSNLEEWDSVQESITDAEKNAQEALDKAQEAKDYIDNTLPGEISEINARLDGVVENWFYKYTPTRENEPALTWIADGTDDDHAGDTFTNIQEYVDDETTPDAGKSWRWALVDGQYIWTPIADSDAVKALQEAAKAQDIADQKRRVFVTTPYTPYDVGDIWTQGPDGEIMRCIVARLSGEYDASDWDKASKYTDDTAANKANDRISDIEYLKEIFGKPIVDSEGAILAKLLAIKDDTGKVKAGLNASDEGKDDSYGRLLFFAGSDDIQSISSADTRIYENGLIVAKAVDLEGYINATSGKIGGFEITAYENFIAHISAVQEEEDNTYTMDMSNASLFYSNAYGQIRVGVELHNMEETPMLDIVTQDLSRFYPMVGMRISSIGANAVSILCNNGQFYGLRPKTYFTMAPAYALTAFDFFILAYRDSGSLTLSLYSSPENGQTYFIIKADASFSMYINGNGKTIHRAGYGDYSNVGIDNSYIGLIVVVYSAEDNKWWMVINDRV